MALLATRDLLAHPVLFLAVYALATAALWRAARHLRHSALSAATVLGVAAFLRLVLLPLPPALSEDMRRYLWDGRVAAAGLNPYRLAPADPSLAPLRDGLWQQLPHRDVPTIYPPAAVALFSIAAQMPRSELAWKAMVAGADLVGCWGLIVLLRRQGAGAGAAVLYAWHPLVALETAGMGHVDAIGGAAALGAVALLLRGRAGSSGVAAATAVLVKLVPAAALPLWARCGRRPWRFLGIAIALTAVALLPVLLATGGVPPGLVRYGVSWEFNGPLHLPLTHLFAAADLSTLAKSALDAAKEWTGAHELWNRFYPYAYPELLAKLVLAAAAVGVVGVSLRERDVIAGTGRLFGRLLLLAATVYPWYLLWVLPWAVLRRERAWFVLAAAAPLAYLPKAADVALWPWLFLMIWVPFWIALVADRKLRRGAAR